MWPERLEICTSSRRGSGDRSPGSGLGRASAALAVLARQVLARRCQLPATRSRSDTVALAVLVIGAWVSAGCQAGSAGSNADRDERVLVLAAASTREALESVGEQYTRRTGVPVTISAGPSNALANQVLAGVPADIYVSANARWAELVASKGEAARVRPLLGNDLVLIVPAGNPAGVRTPADLLHASVARVALAGEAVPAGEYAEQALRATGVLAELLGRNAIARGQDVRMTMSYVERGEAEAGVVYSTDAAVSRAVSEVYRFPAETHEPIVYPAVLLRRGAGRQAGRGFYAALFSEEAARIFGAHGFRQAVARRASRAAG